MRIQWRWILQTAKRSSNCKKGHDESIQSHGSYSKKYIYIHNPLNGCWHSSLKNENTSKDSKNQYSILAVSFLESQNISESRGHNKTICFKNIWNQTKTYIKCNLHLLRHIEFDSWTPHRFEWLFKFIPYFILKIASFWWYRGNTLLPWYSSDHEEMQAWLRF